VQTARQDAKGGQSHPAAERVQATTLYALLDHNISLEFPPPSPDPIHAQPACGLDAPMWYITRILSALLFLFSVVFTIPLAFDVGGRTCGLAFSLSLSAFYFFYSALRLATPDRSRLRYALVNTIAASQWIVIPTLMIWSLNKFSVDSDASAWVEKTFSGKRAQHDTFYAWVFGSDGLVQSLTIGGWDKLLRWSTPVFQLSEGFCSLLV
ncbi:hypothetical protein KCU86_g23410, partial [Aureobasidium melanogenum]